MNSVQRADHVGRRRQLAYLTTAVVLTLSYPVMLRGVSWRSDAQVHTLFETSATLLALVVGTISLVRFYSRKDNAFLVIGAAFLGTALLDAYHSVVTSTFFAVYLPSGLESLIPWSWLASRLFLSALLFLRYFAWQREERLGAAGRINEGTVSVTVGLLSVSSFLFFAFVPLPRAYYEELLFHRPEEFVPAVFFVLTFWFFYRKGDWRQDPFEHWLLLALVINVVAQVVFMPFSSRLYDLEFDIAHLLKNMSYLGVLTGLLINMHAYSRVEQARIDTARLYQAEAKSREELSRAHQELKQLTESLEVRVRERTQELEDANRDLKEAQEQLVRTAKMASIGTMASGVAHEVNTPIASVASSQETLSHAIRAMRETLQDSQGVVAPKLDSLLSVIDDCLGVIRSGATRVAQYVRRLRNFTGSYKADLQTVDVHVGIREAINLIEPELGERIVLRTEFADLPKIGCYPGPLNQVFLDLLMNATQAIRGHGEITVKTSRSGQQILIAITDDGVGMSPETESQLFDMVFTTKNRRVGTSLGLPISFQIVKDHRGEIRVESDLDKGSTFTVVLPTNLVEMIGGQVG